MIIVDDERQLWHAMDAADRRWHETQSEADFNRYMLARSDYQRALIVEARHKQGEY